MRSNVRPERFGQTVLHEVAGDARARDIARSRGIRKGAIGLPAPGLISATICLRARRSDGRAAGAAPELVRLLLERGADPVEADAEPWATPQAWAEMMGARQRARGPAGAWR